MSLRWQSSSVKTIEHYMLIELDDMQSKLQSLIGEIQTSVDAISTASSQISSGNIDLSQRTEQQASSLQETAASMEQVASTVKNNTQHTGEANQLAHTASRSASHGGRKSLCSSGQNARADRKFREDQRYCQPD